MTKRLTAAACLGALMVAASPAPASDPAGLSSLARLGTVDERYLSYNVEMVEVTGGRFWAPFGGPPGERYRMRPPVDLSDAKLRGLARNLGPAYIRVSGTWANSTYLPLEGETVTTPPTGFNQILTLDQWRGVVRFAKAVDARIVTSFPASAGARNPDGSWNPEQARRLLNLTRQTGGSIYGAELFNEPTMPQHGAFPKDYSAADFGRDFAIFRAWARKEAPGLKLTGAGGTAEGTMLKSGAPDGGLSSEDLLKGTGAALDIASYHHYGTVSPRCGLMAFGTADKALTPEFLALTETDYAFYAGLRDRFAPGKPLWLNETAQAACGGSPWASTFLDSFRFLNQLGVLAQKGVQVVAHNTLDASDYGMIDQTSHVPRPNYWAAVLWRRTMGTTVLASPPSPAADLRIYAQCLRGKARGVGLVAINTGDSARQLTVTRHAMAWVMTAPAPDSRTVLINGHEPQADSRGNLTGLDGVAASGSLSVPAKGIAFVAAPDAGNAACR